MYAQPAISSQRLMPQWLAMDTDANRHGRIGDYVVTAPLILGHELSGRIVAVGEDVPQTQIANGSPSSPRRTAESAVNAAPGATTSVQTWSSTPPRQSTAHSRSIA
jgi:Alcohol dehydrogenase GroES-like domain